MLIELIFLALIVCLFISILNASQKKPGTPPGSVGLPVIGHMFLSKKSILELLKDFKEKYGNTFWIKLGSRKMVLLCEPESIREAFNNPDLTGRFVAYSSSLFRAGDASNGVIFNEGDAWKNVRRFCLRIMRDGGMGKSSMEAIIMREVEDLVNDFEKHLGISTPIPWSLNTAILNITWRIVGDKRFDVDDLRVNKLNQYLSDSLDNSQAKWLVCFNMMPWLDNVIPNFIKQNYLKQKDFNEQVIAMEEEMQKTVTEHRNTLDEDHPRDLIDAYLIQLNKLIKDPGSQSEEYSTFKEKELIYMVFDLFLAGSETTSSTIRWFLLFMAKNPEVQRKIHEEISKVVPEDRMPCLADRANLPYLEASIHEAMRLRTLLPLGLFHRATSDTKLGEYLIPKDTYVVAFLESVHTNPKYWEHPDKFYPEHFLNPDKTFNTKRTEFLAFSTGRRVCLGESLARMILFLMLSAIMQKFSFSVPAGEFIDDQRPEQSTIISIPKKFNLLINKL